MVIYRKQKRMKMKKRRNKVKEERIPNKEDVDKEEKWKREL